MLWGAKGTFTHARSGGGWKIGCLSFACWRKNYNGATFRPHDDVIKWKHFPCYQPFVRGIHWYFPSQRPVTLSFDVFFDLRSLWHHCSAVMHICTSKLGHPWRGDWLVACLVLQAITITHWGRDKWPPLFRRHFQMHFLEWKCVNLDEDFTEVCSQGSN